MDDFIVNDDSDSRGGNIGDDSKRNRRIFHSAVTSNHLGSTSRNMFSTSSSSFVNANNRYRITGVALRENEMNIEGLGIQNVISTGGAGTERIRIDNVHQNFFPSNKFIEFCRVFGIDTSYRVNGVNEWKHVSIGKQKLSGPSAVQPSSTHVHTDMANVGGDCALLMRILPGLKVADLVGLNDAELGLVTDNLIYVNEDSSKDALSRAFLEMRTLDYCCADASGPLRALSSVDIMDEVSNVLDMSVMSFELVRSLAQECIEYEGSILSGDIMSIRTYKTSSYIGYKLQWIHSLNQRSTKLKPATNRKRVQCILNVFFEQTLAQILYFLFHQRSAMITAIDAGAHDGESIEMRYLKLACDAVSVSIAALFYESLSSCQTFWVSFNRCFLVYFNVAKVCNDEHLLYKSYTAVFQTALSRLCFSTYPSHGISAEFSLSPSSVSSFSKTNVSDKDSKEDRVDMCARGIIYYLLIVSRVMESVVQVRTGNYTSSTRIPSNWILLHDCQTVLATHCGLSCSASCGMRMTLLQHLPSFASIWDSAELGIEIVCSMAPFLMKYRSKSKPMSPNILSEDPPTGIERFLVESRGSSDEIAKSESEANLYGDALWLLSREPLITSEVQVHFDRQKIGSQMDVIDRIGDLISSYFRLNGLASYASVHDQAREFQRDEKREEYVYKNLSEMSRIEIACRIGASIAGLLARSNKDSSSIHNRRLRESLSSEFNSALPLMLSSCGQSRETAFINGIISGIIIPEVLKVVGYQSMFMADTGKGELSNLYWRFLDAVEPENLVKGTIKTPHWGFRGTDWLVASKLVINFEVCCLESDLEPRNIVLPVQRLLQEITRKVESELQTTFMLSQESTQDAVMGLVLGNQFLSKLNQEVKEGECDPNRYDPDLMNRASTVTIYLMSDLLRLALLSLSQKAGEVKSGLHNCGIQVARNIVILLCQKCQLADMTSSFTSSPTSPEVSETFEKILRQLGKLVQSIGTSLRQLVFEVTPIRTTTQMDSSWKQLVAAVETCSICCILSVLASHNAVVYHCPSGRHISRQVKHTMPSATVFSQDTPTVKETVGMISRLSIEKCPIIDIWLKCIFWTPFLRAACRFRTHLEASVGYDCAAKYFPIVLCVRRNIQEVLTTWVACLSTLQLHPHVTSPKDIGISEFYRCLFELFDSKEVFCMNEIRQKISRLLYFPSTISTIVSANEKIKYSSIMFGESRLTRAFEAAMGQWVSEQEGFEKHRLDRLLRNIECNSFETSTPLLANFFRSLSNSRVTDHKERELMWREHNKLRNELRRCVNVLLNASAQAKTFDRVKRLSEVKAINSLFVGEMSRVLSIDDVRGFIKDFASQIQIIYDIQTKSDRNVEKMNIVRYFPLYIRSISTTAFSTKLCEWRCLLYGLCMQLKRSREESKNFDIMDNIICSILVSLSLPADTPSYTIIANNASGYLNLLKTVQSGANHLQATTSIQQMDSSSDFSPSRYFSRGSTKVTEPQNRLNQFREYILHDESSFLDALRDSKKLEYAQDIPAAISTQGMLKLKLCRVERIIVDILTAPSVEHSVERSLLQDFPHCHAMTNYVFNESQAISILSSVSLFISQLFRMFLGESSASVVNIISFRRVQDSIRDILDRILFAEDLLFHLAHEKLNLGDIIIDLDSRSSVLTMVLPSWRGMIQTFCRFFGSTGVRESHSSAFLRAANETISAFTSKCEIPQSQCTASKCRCCKTSFHTLSVARGNILFAARRLTTLNNENNEFDFQTSVLSDKGIETRLTRLRNIVHTTATKSMAPVVEESI